MSTELDQIMAGETINFDALIDPALNPALSPENATLARMVDAIDELSEDSVRRVIQAAFQGMSDKELCQAYQSTHGQPGNPMADLLKIAAEARSLDL